MLITVVHGDVVLLAWVIPRFRPYKASSESSVNSLNNILNNIYMRSTVASFFESPLHLNYMTASNTSVDLILNKVASL